MSLRTIFTALADQVRRLSGRTGFLGVEAMTDALSGVTLGVDASGLTAGATDVILDKEFIGASGERQLGTMTNNGAVDVTLDASTKTYNVQAGYHNGNGKVQVVTQTKSVTPGASSQTVYPDSGKLLSAVNVAAAVAGGYTGTVTIGSNRYSVSVNVGVNLGENDMLFMFIDQEHTGSRDVVCARRLSPNDVVAYRTNVDSIGILSYSVFDLYGVDISYSGTSFTVASKKVDGAQTSCFTPGDVYRWALIKR